MEGSDGLWGLLFGMSKLPELFDTVFVILRKQKLIFLHWYHHITVFCYCWHAYVYPHGQGRVFVIMNYFVHAVMYMYYAVRAQGMVRIPRFVSVGVTCLQISQMIVGMATFVDAYFILRNGVACNVEYFNIVVGMAMYFSYTILFGHFFYVSYVKAKE
jgi:elongation of very long chain fatty acids protein 6